MTMWLSIEQYEREEPHVKPFLIHHDAREHAVDIAIKRLCDPDNQNEAKTDPETRDYYRGLLDGKGVMEGDIRVWVQDLEEPV